MKLKKILCIFLVTAVLIPYSVHAQQDTVWREVYVAVDGNDSADGSSDRPFATVERAKEYVRTISDDMKGDIIVHIGEGTYFLDDTLRFTNEDSGKNGYRIIYKGENLPQISGGVKVGKFERTEYEGIYKANVDGINTMHELYINGRKAYVASSNRQIQGIGYYDDPKTSYKYDGMYISRSDIGEYKNPEDIEFNWQINWKNNTCNVENIIPDPENPDQVIALMQQNWWDMHSALGDDGLCAKPYRDFVVKNAFELLDNPGEFYYNRKEKTVYYIPRENENLETAEVIAPRIDKILKFDGISPEERVRNITLDGIKIAHVAFFGLTESQGLETAQAQNARRSNDVPWCIPASVTLARSEDISFCNCYFFGFGAGGIHIQDAVDGTLIDGNAFSDIGDASIVVGDWRHGGINSTYESVQVVPPEDAGELNLIDGTAELSASYWGNFDVLSGSKNWADKSDYNMSQSWDSDPYAPRSGKKSWIRYDFDAPYNITKIQLGFLSNTPNEKRSGFEVLLSNDRYFTEGNYVTVAVQNEPADNIQDYIPKENIGKYRYIMIRTLEPTELSLSGVWVFTNDRKPYTVMVPTRNNTISNNYITRSGETICSGGGINVFYATGVKIVDNEICNTPYSGLMFGWGWRNNATGSGDNYIARNYIHNTNNTMHDGAAIYSLSCQPGTIVEENYVRDVFIGAGAFYPDEGTAYSTWRNNVSEDVYRNYNIWLNTIRENKFLSSYGWHNINRNDGTDNVFEAINQYLPGNETGKAYQIKQNAGLKPEYRHLKELVPDVQLEVGDLRGFFAAEGGVGDCVNYIRAVANNMLENGSFGNMYGDYPIEYKYKLKDALFEIGDMSNSNYNDSVLKLRSLINEAADNVIRVPLDELIDACDKELKNTPVSSDKSVEGSVTSKEKSDFEKIVKSVKEKKQSSLSVAEEYDTIQSLESAYRGFVDKKSGYGVEYLWVDGMIDESIDSENRIITVTMPANADITACKTDVVLEGTAKSALAESTHSYENEWKLPIYCDSLKGYVYWTVKPKQITDKQWYNIATEKQVIYKTEASEDFLSIYNTPHMSGRFYEAGEKERIKFVPKSDAEQSSMCFIFAANTAENFEKTTVYPKDDHFRMDIKNGKASIYEYENGVEKLIKSDIEFPVSFNEENEIAVKLIPAAEKTVIVIWLNGTVRANVLADRKALSGYIGFFNQKNAVKISEQ